MTALTASFTTELRAPRRSRRTTCRAPADAPMRSSCSISAACAAIGRRANTTISTCSTGSRTASASGSSTSATATNRSAEDCCATSAWTGWTNSRSGMRSTSLSGDAGWPRNCRGVHGLRSTASAGHALLRARQPRQPRSRRVLERRGSCHAGFPARRNDARVVPDDRWAERARVMNGSAQSRQDAFASLAALLSGGKAVRAAVDRGRSGRVSRDVRRPANACGTSMTRRAILVCPGLPLWIACSPRFEPSRSTGTRPRRTSTGAWSNCSPGRGSPTTRPRQCRAHGQCLGDRHAAGDRAPCCCRRPAPRRDGHRLRFDAAPARGGRLRAGDGDRRHVGIRAA